MGSNSHRSLIEEYTEHDGVFIVHPNDVEVYIDKYKPQCLRCDARTELPNAINFGDSKGLTLDRVLIKPTNKMDETTLAKFYVAVTRAKYSVGFISSTESVEIKEVSYFKEVEFNKKL